PSKNLGGFGDGGMVATEDEGLAELVRMLLKHGGRDKYNVDHVGYNARIDTLQAAVLLAKLKHIDEFNSKRREVADIYNDGLKGISGIELPGEIPDGNHVFHQYTIRVKAGKRDLLQKHLSENGVSTMVYYPVPLHKMLVFQNGRAIKGGDLSESEKAVTEVLSLPVEPLMKPEGASCVCEGIKGFFK
ncbi:MAG: DegT/DnrJ/EryC1/StrS family aminotransferase, partial [Nitrospiraceae bacterium]|nr:DegT/DnrJ/EryC1/StrS family aminotransferase [Nitrospiraceae bacterium]